MWTGQLYRIPEHFRFLRRHHLRSFESAEQAATGHNQTTRQSTLAILVRLREIFGWSTAHQDLFETKLLRSVSSMIAGVLDLNA